MTSFKLTILGTNAALPAYGRFTSMQVLNVHENLFMIDCGEGAQIRLSQYKIKRNKIKAIFISHLHGDHLFGLPGLITSFSHLNRKDPLKIFGPVGIKKFIDTVLECSQSFMTYEIEIYEMSHGRQQEIYADHSVKVDAFTMKHRIPTYGFKFKEFQKPANVSKQAIKEYNLSIEQIKAAKKGEDVSINGQIISNSKLTLERKKARSYAYCSDTVFDEDLIPIVKGVDLLYHETTYLDDLKDLARERMHATTKEAASIAKKANVGQLVLGHYSGRYKNVDSFLEEAQSIFSDTVLGYDGVMIHI